MKTITLLALLFGFASLGSAAPRAAQTKTPSAPRMAGLVKSLETIGRRPLVPEFKKSQLLTQLNPGIRRAFITNTLQYVKEVVEFKSAQPFDAAKSQAEIKELRQIRSNLKWLRNYLINYLEPRDNAIFSEAFVKTSDKIIDTQIAQERHMRKMADALGQTRTSEEIPVAAGQEKNSAHEKQNAAADAVLKSYREDWDVATKGTGSRYFGTTSRFAETAALFSTKQPNEGLQRAVVTGLVKEFRATSDSAYRNYLLRGLSRLAQQSVFPGVKKVAIEGIMNRRYFVYSRLETQYSFDALGAVTDIAVASKHNSTKELAARLLRRELARVKSHRVYSTYTPYLNLINQVIGQIKKSEIKPALQTPPAPAQPAEVRAGALEILYGHNGGMGYLRESNGGMVWPFQLDVLVDSKGEKVSVALTTWGTGSYSESLDFLNKPVKFTLEGDKVTRVELLENPEKTANPGDAFFKSRVFSFIDYITYEGVLILSLAAATAINHAGYNILWGGFLFLSGLYIKMRRPL